MLKPMLLKLVRKEAEQHERDTAVCGGAAASYDDGRADTATSCHGRAPYSSRGRTPPYHGATSARRGAFHSTRRRAPSRRGASHRRGSSSDRASSHDRGTGTAPYHGPNTAAADRARLRRRVVRSNQRPAGVFKRSRPFSSSSSSPSPRDKRSRPLLVSQALEAKNFHSCLIRKP